MMKFLLLLLFALSEVVLQTGCFVVREAVVDTVKVGAYATTKTAKVAAKTTVNGGKLIVHGTHKAADALTTSATPAPVPAPATVPAP